MILSCDLSQLDAFAPALLTNDEVIDVDQDFLGKAAGRRARAGSTEVWARPLHDGSVAVGLFNLGPAAVDVTARWSDLGLHGKQQVRDLWLQKDIGLFDEAFTASVPPHGAVLVKIGKPG